MRSQIDSLLIERNFTINDFPTVIEYLDAVTNQFKATYQYSAENGSFDLYYNGFFLSQMLLSCLYQVFSITILKMKMSKLFFYYKILTQRVLYALETIFHIFMIMTMVIAIGIV